ncbi:hypothetical protein EPUS_04477 [Endocarpon pusillum Z07020]|uniref:PPIase cyclophilin-type domain-containing protein n=1 Tax=Endocarpon pusillum (strain Z07020 / HMAS-L-300199) TaxID=1263415 RepID=U1GG78_ENDPU|nr:uncharacterized protein EPUS_04477 [Endocarpon pusillum Z07020]ERF76657.1 hypothetical protein EPUS_04477 [Endocarpon pusillum Z07020]
MSSHYTTEPPPTASVLLHTTAGPIQISLFATQTPLASRNFLQHILDGYYTSTTFHRVVPGFVIQGGDPTGTGEGGESIYEDREFEIDARTGEKVVFGDEVHSRLKLNRRGLVGMAKMGESTYGSQFFITLADVRAQLDGKCTMFGRVEGEGIYNIVRIAEAENVEGIERPMYPFRITGAEVLEMPKGEPWASMKKRERVAKRTAPQDEEMEGKAQKKAKTKKKGKTLLSFGDEEGDTDTGPAIQPKAKFNTRLINGTASKQDGAANGQREPDPEKFQSETATKPSSNQPQDSYSKKTSSEITKLTRHRSSPNSSPHSPSKRSSKSPSTQRRKPSFHDPTTQLPLKDPESPSRSPTPSPGPPSKTPTTTLNAEIAALKASMRRNVPTASEKPRKKSALEQLIPEKSIRGRKRPRPGDSGGSTLGSNNDRDALKMLNAFKARLEGIGRNEMEVKRSSKAKDEGKRTSLNGNGVLSQQSADATMKEGKEDDDHGEEEAALCDLHFIANCLSCSHWDRNPSSDLANHSDQQHPHSSASADEEDADPTGDTDWMSHALSFEKDRLGKDLTWKRKNEEELVVIDPREKEKDLAASGKLNRRSGKREREWGGRGK